MHNASASAVLLLSLGAMSCTDREVAGFTTVAKASTGVTVLEGLPHPEFEDELYAEAQKTHETKEIEGHLFYAEAIEAGSGEASALRAQLSDTDRFESWSGEKKCGGFHPDFAVTFKGPSEVTALLCFGCQEVLLISDEQRARRDLASPEALVQALSSFQRNRPERTP